eukprot:4364460-Alexandrium_andersonii.AAC.1
MGLQDRERDVRDFLFHRPLPFGHQQGHIVESRAWRIGCAEVVAQGLVDVVRSLPPVAKLGQAKQILSNVVLAEAEAVDLGALKSPVDQSNNSLRTNPDCCWTGPCGAWLELLEGKAV